MNNINSFRPGILKKNATLLGTIQQALDVFIVLALLYVLTLEKLGYFPPPYQLFCLVASLIMVIVYQWTNTYARLRIGGVLLEAQTLFKAWGITLLLLTAIGFVTKSNEIFSREVMLRWAVIGYFVQLLSHAVVRVMLQAARSHGLNTRNALLIGEIKTVNRFMRLLSANPWLGIHVIGYLDNGTGQRDEEANCGLPRLGSTGQMAQVMGQQQVDIAYIAYPLEQSSEIESVARELMAYNIDVNWVPDLSTLQLINHGVREIDGQPIISLSDSPLGGVRWIGKWLEDKIGALLILLLISPLLLVIAVAVKLSSEGPILFRQKRGGLDGREIVVWKFRTMKVHTEGKDTVTQASKGDPRVTRIGAFLRRTSLDELPQFFNVLQGRMSIVGPRPHAIEHNSYYETVIDSYMLRHRLKPGITGWAQVNGWRGETDVIEKMDMRVKYDLYYINNWSVWFDLRIIAMTVWSVIKGQNAY